MLILWAWGGVQGRRGGGWQLLRGSGPSWVLALPSLPHQHTRVCASQSINGASPLLLCSLLGFSKPFCTHDCIQQPQDWECISHRDKEMEVCRAIGRTSVRSQPWDAKPRGCLLRPQVAFCPSLPSFLGGRQEQRGGSSGTRRQIKAESARDIPGVRVASVNFQQCLFKH